MIMCVHVCITMFVCVCVCVCAPCTPRRFTPVGAPVTWQWGKEVKHMDLKCHMTEDESICFFSRVVFKEEKYQVKTNIQKGSEHPHHIFHVYPPLVIQNLLPFQIFFESMVSTFAAHVCTCAVHAAGGCGFNACSWW